MRNNRCIGLGFLGFALAFGACSGPTDQSSAATGQGEGELSEAPATLDAGLTTSDPVDEEGSSEAAAPTLERASVDKSGQEHAIFQAAGFTFAQQRRQWESGACGDPPMGIYEAGRVSKLEDLNGDGRPEAVLIESGICYGNIGQRFWLLTQQAGGQWRVMTESIAIPEFLPARGADGFPDIIAGGPGFCFPVLRWNGSEYRVHRHEYEGRPCSSDG